MTVLETNDPNNGRAQEPIKFPGRKQEPIKFPGGKQAASKEEKQEKREERQRRRQERAKAAEAEGRAAASMLLDTEPAPAPVVDPSPDIRPEERAGKAKRRLAVSWTLLSFLLMVAIPGAFAGIYFLVIASPQYRVETQFSVRGASQSSMSTFGLSGLFGSSVQSGDSYIVASYIESVQLVRDVKEQLGIDLRQYFAKNDIDFYYRVPADMPLEKFTEYWRDMIEVSFNSTTGNTTFYIYGFSADDSKAIADAVLKVSETLVNNLSEANRQQMTLMASKQVDRSEERLNKVREQIRQLRSSVKTINFETLSQSESILTQQLENQLQSLKTRYATLMQSVSKDSPQARALQKQIKALEDQLLVQRDKMGLAGPGESVAKGGDDRNIAEVLNKFEELTVEQGFATQAYTTALAAFETALAEAQKQERYFATFVAPTRPEIALYPMRILDTFIALLVLLAVWMISQFLYRSFRDHAI